MMNCEEMGLKEKRLPVGIENFEELQRENFYYVDKTFFIKELLQNQEEVNLFIRPRCFGKTLNLSMIKCFFEIGCERTLFNGLKIMQEKELCENYMGQFPVIFISLKSVDGLNYEAANAALRNVIGREALRFQFLQKSNCLSEEEKNSYRRLIKIGSDSQAFFDMTDAVLTASLQILTQLLEKHYNHKVILLIDEYDVPLDKAFQQGYYDEMVSLLRNMLGNVLKTNDALYFAVLTGCLRICKESIFTGLNNLKAHTISDVRYDEYFGFTDADVQKMLNFYDISSHIDIVNIS